MTASIRRVVFGVRTGFVLVAVAAVMAGLTGPIAPSPASAEDAGLTVLGELDHGCLAGEGEPGKTFITVLSIDADAQQLYALSNCTGGQRFIVHDISTEIPTVTQVGPRFPDGMVLRLATSFKVLVSTELGRLLILNGESRGPVIQVFDMETLEHVETWNMSEKIPGFFPMGFSHDPALDRVYLVGAFEGGQTQHELFLTAGGVGGARQAAIIAVEDTSGDPIWINPLRSCDEPLNSRVHGGMVAQSAHRPMLYTFCQGDAAAGQQVGQGGVVRLNVRHQQDATGLLVDFPQEFFPVSGQYAADSAIGLAGVAALEPERERFVAHSLSGETHGAWVFDGLRSTWIGFVAAPDSTNAYFGLDSATGKHYMGGGKAPAGEEPTGYINVTDAGATPVPQGRLFRDIRSSTPWARDAEGSLQVKGNIQVDPATGRLFVPYQHPSNIQGVLVVRDTTPPITPRTPLDLDELTHELPDDERARLEFSANTSGFGAQYVQVGGWENVYTRITVPLFGFKLTDHAENPAEIRYGNRGATMSLVEQVGVAQSGSSATAIATKPDDNTPADAQTKQNDAENQANEATDGGVDDLSDAVDDSTSDDDDPDDEEVQETGYVTCLDGDGDDGEPVPNEQGSEEQPAHAKVVCDLDNLETTAQARFSGGSGGGGVVVSDSSFDGRTYRDEDRGIVAETEAIADGIFFGEPEVGGFTIDRVTSTATTWAKGLDGTSHVRWVRTVEGMRTIGADGTASESTSCTTTVESGKKIVEEGECRSLQEDLNDLMPNRFEVKFPLPEVVATPGGAFASVQENETDFLSGQATNNDQRRMVPGMEMTVFADGPQRGRLWVQLAAVKADATFIRSPIQDFQFGGGEDTGGIDEGGTSAPPATGHETGALEAPSSGGTTVASPGTTDEPEVAGEDSMTIASHQERLIGGFGWLPALRSLGDAVLTGALYLVFLLPIAEIVRRRRLLDVLTNGGPADESSLSTPKSPARVSGSPVRVSGSPVGSTS